jgi:hypothetical protein
MYPKDIIIWVTLFPDVAVLDGDLRLPIEVSARDLNFVNNAILLFRGS